MIQNVMMLNISQVKKKDLETVGVKFDGSYPMERIEEDPLELQK
jgi:hypothetical protein